MRKDILNAPRLNELKRRRRRNVSNKILLLLFGVSVVVAGCSYLSKFPRLNIKEVEIMGNKVLDADMLKTEVRNHLSGNYVWLFPKTNILFYPQKAIKNILQDKFKTISAINLSITDTQNLAVSLTERVPKYTWCGHVTKLLNSNSNQKCYFLDSEGYIFDEAPYFSPGVYLKFYGDVNVNLENPPGVYFLKDKFAQIITFKNRLTEFGINVNSFWLNNLGDAYFFLSTKEELGPKIIFKLDSDLEKVAENLHTALNTEPLKTKFKTKFSALEYIDLRFGNKVYDKFR